MCGGANRAPTAQERSRRAQEAKDSLSKRAAAAADIKSNAKPTDGQGAPDNAKPSPSGGAPTPNIKVGKAAVGGSAKASSVREKAAEELERRRLEKERIAREKKDRLKEAREKDAEKQQQSIKEAQRKQDGFGPITLGGGWFTPTALPDPSRLPL